MFEKTSFIFQEYIQLGVRVSILVVVRLTSSLNVLNRKDKIIPTDNTECSQYYCLITNNLNLTLCKALQF